MWQIAHYGINIMVSIFSCKFIQLCSHPLLIWPMHLIVAVAVIISVHGVYGRSMCCMKSNCLVVRYLPGYEASMHQSALDGYNYDTYSMVSPLLILNPDL